MPATSGLVKKQIITKTNTEIQDTIPSIAGLATTNAFNFVEIRYQMSVI